MNQKTSSKRPLEKNNKKLIDMIDLEILFMNAIAICAFLLAVVATDIFFG